MSSRFLFVIFLLISLSSFAQKEDYVWSFGDYVWDFKENPPAVSFFMHDYGQTYANLSDSKGNLLYVFRNRTLYNSDGKKIADNLHGYYSTPVAAPLVPYPDSNKALLICYEPGSGVVCSEIDNDTNEKKHLKIISQDLTQSFAFIQQGYTSNLWLVISEFNRNNDHNMEITLITKDGFQETKTYTHKYRITDPVVSHDNSMIIYQKTPNNYVAISFDNINGEFGEELYSVPPGNVHVFSSNDKYLYYVENLSYGSYNLCRGLITADGIEDKSIIRSFSSYVNVKTGPDGNIYVISDKKLSMISDAESDTPQFHADIATVDAYNFPATFRYRRGFTADVTCDAVSFDCNIPSAVSYLWDLGDGNTLSDKSFTYVYKEPGVYNVTLTVKIDDGMERVISEKVTVGKLPKKPVIRYED